MRWLRGLYLDLRSLALFRIALGLCVIADLLLRLPNFEAFYSDRGIMPREAMFRALDGTWAVSLHFISGERGVQLLLLLAALVLAIGMVIGYRSRLCTAGCWLLVMSMQVRSPLILHSGDELLRMLLFWSMFVPLNARYSLDRALNPATTPSPRPLLSSGGLALTFQICAVYWYTAAEKMHPVWLTERSAIYYALNLDQFATSFGRFLLGFPTTLQVMTTGTLVLELLGPLLVLSPFRTDVLRLVAVALFLSFHAGLSLSLHLGLFPWVCAAAWLVFLPTSLWEYLGRRLARGPSGVTLFFDAGCGFCRKAVLIVRELLLLVSVDLREAQSDHAMHAAMRAGNSWIVRDKAGVLHEGYDAFVALCLVSPVARPVAGLVGRRAARAFGERIYRLISSNRDRASHLLARLTPPPPRVRLGVVSSVVALLALVLVESVLARRPTFGLSELKRVEQRLIELAQLGQSWRMFAPFPTLDDGWYVIEGVTADGRRLDIWNGGGAPDYRKPAHVWPLYRNSQWQKYLVNLWQRRNRRYRVHFVRYLCRTWNEHHAGKDRVELVYVNYMLEWTPPPGETLQPAVKEPVSRHECSDSGALPLVAR